MMVVYTVRRTRERVMVHRETGRGTEIKRQTGADNEERLNLHVFIRSGMLFTLKMTALSVILKPQSLAKVQADQSIIQKISTDILAEGGKCPNPLRYVILQSSSSLNEWEEYCLQFASHF